MSTPCCLNCIWFRYAVPYCTCPYEPPECEWEQITVQDTAIIAEQQGSDEIDLEVLERRLWRNKDD